MVRVVIVDDNPAELKFLRNVLQREDDVKILAEETNGEQAFRTLKRLKPDAAFIDISMPGLSGIEVVKKLDQDTFTVFFTAYQEHALEAFELGSVDYILKPATPERIEKSLKRIRRYLWSKESIKKLSVNIKGEIVTLDINKIIFIEKLPMQRKVRIYTRDKEFTVSGDLNKFEDKLKGCGFVRSHKSYLVNVNKISKLIPWGDKSYLAKLVGTSKEVLISRKYAPLVKSLINI